MHDSVVIVEYDPAWPDVFATLRDRVLGALGDVAVAVEHVGSTSISGMAAKPIIDMDVVVLSVDDIPCAVARLSLLGYMHLGDRGIPGREAFSQPAGTPDHHLYVCASDSAELHRHLAFRDYLRTHPEEARDLSEHKRAAARHSRGDRGGYMRRKDLPVKGVVRRAMTWASASRNARLASDVGECEGDR
jgi:GrpB-like predicted nucleotidyltransferase (UPF0157 family)